ncbi:5-oxoprolinase subunit PxpB [Mesorhizobium sp. PUT5]|uniref:5-oxoprolinase subunit PxpB n=1 Tax=Mesorhizobium sp. PUT5 TaxID=3454629 RepID=UPI003FA46F4F
MAVDAPRISLAGSGALLLDGAQGAFSDAVQQRVWAVANAALALAGVRETVPGMNNLLVLFDPLATDATDIGARLGSLWVEANVTQVAGRQHAISVFYGGARGEDLPGWAAHCGMPVEEAVRRHAAATYTVAAVGAMPGFPYLSGLDPKLAWARRSTPRFKVAEGAVIIGGAQAGIMPMTAPSGWHIIGHTDAKLFDANAESPVLLMPGDTIRFTVADIVT